MQKEHRKRRGGDGRANTSEGGGQHLPHVQVNILRGVKISEQRRKGREKRERRDGEQEKARREVERGGKECTVNIHSLMHF